MVHENSPIPCVGKPFSFAQSRSSLLQNTETIWWRVLKENITKQCPTHDPSQQKSTLFLLENQPMQSPGLPQGSSCQRVRKDECYHRVCVWQLEVSLLSALPPSSLVTDLCPRQGEGRRTLRGSSCLSLFPCCGWEALKPDPSGVRAGVCT